MPDIHVVFLLAALMPGAVLAQALSPEPLLAPPLVAAPEEPAFTPMRPPEGVVEEELDDGVSRYSLSPGRVAVEALGGAAGGVGATFASVFVLTRIDAERWSCSGDVCDGRAIGALAMLSCALGSTTGVYAAGELMGGGGRFLPTMVTGLVMGGATAGLFLAGIDESAEVIIPLMAVPMVSSLVAYEVSAAYLPSRPARFNASRSPALTWAPTIALTSKGGALGLTGRF